MRSASIFQWFTRAALAAALIVLFVGVSGCQQAKDFMAKQSGTSETLAAEEQEAAAEAQRLATEALALEEEAREEARKEAEALAEAEADAKAAQEAMEEAERQLAEQKAALAEKEEQLRRQQALQAEKERLAARQATLAEQEQALFEREQDLEAREVNIAVAEDELRERALPSVAAEDGEPAESDGWSDEEGFEPADGREGEALPESSGYSSTATLQPGKVIEVEILETLSSRTHRLGDTFSGRLVQDLRAEDGTLVVAAGAEVVGEITEVTPLKKVGGQASLGIEFTRIVVAPGESVAISASLLERGVDKSKDKKKIIGATIAGAILGRVLGGKGGENAAVGAVVGAAAGTAAVARSKGKDAEIPAGEMVALQLDEVVTVEIDMTGTVDRE